MRNGKPITDVWLSQQLRPYGIRPSNIWIADNQAKGYLESDFSDVFRRYISRSDVDAFATEIRPPPASAAAACTATSDKTTTPM